MPVQGLRVHITGVVQGVGFRPFVYGLALDHGLKGWVRNTSAGVEIEVDGAPDALAGFADALQNRFPPLARLDHFEAHPQGAQGFSDFVIVHSEAIAQAFQPISPDVSLCDDCRKELFDPGDRRYRYPFINCTNCGPRFTIIQDIPYDRPKTTMAPFPMCPDCAREYANPLNRRFHAQPVACPVCGPHIWLEAPGTGDAVGCPQSEDAMASARAMLAGGKILAVRGLGGFHLVCDAANPEAVAELRRRKLRVDKPFAVMVPDLAAASSHCQMSEDERTILTSRERPIVILDRLETSTIVEEAAPYQRTLGIMLPYTPLHELLLARAPGYPDALVMTSGNLSEEPIATGLAEARERLSALADAFLIHNREIHIRCDDSVVRVLPRPDSGGNGTAPGSSQNPGEPEPLVGDTAQARVRSQSLAAPTLYPLRRARGYAPFPVRLPWDVPPMLAVGGELKNAFCLGRDRYAFLSHHIGDMENYETLRAFEEGIAHYERLFRIVPEIIVYDLHPNYMATRYALARAEAEGLRAIGVQHHHAHIASLMAEHSLGENDVVIGLSFDGTGYGTDGVVWGGEVLLASYSGYQRSFHLNQVPLLGGDKAVREPWRMALAWLASAGVSWEPDLPPAAHASAAAPAGLVGAPDVLDILRRQYDSGVNTVPTTSMGRLFDAAAALMGIRQVASYEAQAAIEMEMACDAGTAGTEIYPFDYSGGVMDALPLIRALAADVRTNTPVPLMAARFHHTIATLALEVCRDLCAKTGINLVALSGGVWQNRFLLLSARRLLEDAGFKVLIHREVPSNDGGLALGQLAVGFWAVQDGRAHLLMERQQEDHAG